jgi:hypothetical protein
MHLTNVRHPSATHPARPGGHTFGQASSLGVACTWLLLLASEDSHHEHQHERVRETMTRLDFGPCVLFARLDGQTAVLAYTPGEDDELNWNAWDAAVAAAATRGYLIMDDDPDFVLDGIQVFLITR